MPISAQTNERKEVDKHIKRATRFTYTTSPIAHRSLCLCASQAMCFQVRDALRVGCIGLSGQFFCNTMAPKEMIKIIDDEMRNFCVLVEAPKTPFGRVKKTYSGKVGGRQDDVCIVLQLAVTGARQFYQSEKYNNFRGSVY